MTRVKSFVQIGIRVPGRLRPSAPKPTAEKSRDTVRRIDAVNGGNMPNRPAVFRKKDAASGPAPLRGN